MNIIYNLSERHISQLHALYQREWWTRGRTLEDTKRGVSGSQICIGLVGDNDELIGFSRVLTDYTFKALIFDVIVSEGKRSQGLGNQLLSLIKNHEKLKSVKHLELYCVPEMFPFYEKHGFSTNVGNIMLVRLVNA